MPSLFSYATKELAQDALLCWLLEWLNHPGHALAEASWRLFGPLVQRMGIRVSPAGIRAVRVKRQFHNVDIVAVFELDGDDAFALVIEDKIRASLTGYDQLARNLANAVSYAADWAPLASVKPERIFGVFVKTGYDFDFVCPRNYAKLVGFDFNGWTAGVGDVKNEILSDWVAWWREEWQGVERKLAAVEHIGDDASADWVDNKVWESHWGDAVYQHALFKKLFGIAAEDITEVVEEGGYRRIFFRPSYDSSRREYLLLGTSRGRAWIQYHFDARENRDWFFYRLDWQSGMWGVSLRFYKEKKTADELAWMRGLAGELDRLLKTRGVVTAAFKASDTSTETTCLLIDPYRSARLLELGSVHTEWVTARFLR
jgi:hypothetical protein